MNKPSTLILLATHNGEDFIPQQCESLNKQSNVNISVVVSDDSSTDSTLKIISTSVSSKIILLSQKTQGSAAQNFFRLFRDVDFSDTEFIALSDQDDVWLVSKLSRAVSQITVHQADAYSSNVLAFWPDGKQKLIKKAQPQRQFDYMFESAGPGCTFVLTKKLALEIQAFLIANQEKCKQVALHDWFIYAFARSRGFNWIIDHESHMLYRQHASNVVGANVGLKAKLQRFKKMREGWLFNQAVFIADVLGYGGALPIQKLKRFSLMDRVWIMLNVHKLRRRLRDRFALVFLMLVFIKK